MAGPLIGALRVSLSAETANFEAGMRRAQRTAAQTSTGISKSLGAVKAGLAGFAGALSVGLFTSAIKDALEYASSLAEVAQQVGVTARDLQVFRFAGGQVGVSTEEMDKALQKFTKSLGDARNGSAEAIKTFKALGFTDQDIAKLDVHDALLKTADGVAAVGDRASRASPEVRLFGKAGQQLDPFLSQGSKGINELAAAAEKLGIVLSDEQIRNADETADKLKAVQTVISAKIAGVVADNATAILDLANAFGDLVGSLTQAAAWLANVAREMRRLGQIAPGLANILNADLLPIVTIVGLFSGNKPASSVTTKLPPIKQPNKPLPKFLATDPKGKKAKADHSAEKALTDSFQFDQDIRRANLDILRAQQDLADDYVERTSIGIQILDAEKAAYEAELQYKVALGNLTKGEQGLSSAQAAQLRAANDTKDALERTALLKEEETKRAEDFQELAQHDFDRQRDILEARANIAETASERRKIEIQLLQIAYEQRKQALQNIIDTSKDFKEIEDARRDLGVLNRTFPLAQQSVLQNTRGPMEDWLASLPTTAAKADEALQRLEVQGFEGLIDAAGRLTEGFDSAIDALLQTLQTFIAGLLQMQLQKGLGGFLQGGGGSGALGFLGSLFGGGGGFDSAGFASVVAGNNAALGVTLPGFASGGSGIFKGIPGIDKNVLSMNGMPFARVSHNEPFSFGNDNKPMRMGGPPSIHIHVNGTPNRTTLDQMSATIRGAMAKAAKQGY